MVILTGATTWILTTTTKKTKVGTVLDVEDAKNAINAGAKFLMSPAMVKDIMVDAQFGENENLKPDCDLQILSAYDSGAEIVKDLMQGSDMKQARTIVTMEGLRKLHAF
ncbi:hypothetical protein SO802_010444 [Lithocarpus litseifolius]|uniref:Uncharacterized protein n=1 Tax=Lithocarpus litseifolius TaxID=425828 RepID=A0AAW2DGH3_9ROSI